MIPKLKARELVKLALRRRGEQHRYAQRREAYSNLRVFGCAPTSICDILRDDAPWFCHGLGFRMATYSSANEYLFRYWDRLLETAKNAEGWASEYGEWNKLKDHWAVRWDRFHQFLWMLQCIEHFYDQGYVVSFPVSKKSPAPDLMISRTGEPDRYVECFFYTKWWAKEHYLEDVLLFIDPNLQVERTHNVALPNDHVFSNNAQHLFVELLANLTDAVATGELDQLRAAAKEWSPQTVCKSQGVSVLLNGEGQYCARENCHGDPRSSWGVYFDEIIKHKFGKNGLATHRPNLLMVNGLGFDFQTSFGAHQHAVEQPEDIDEIRIFACGIGAKIKSCDRIFLTPSE